MNADNIRPLANPFAVKTPETLSTREVVNLFVPYPEFENLMDPGHQFINGHRGSGKSMMLRMLTPEAQCIRRSCPVDGLPFFGVYLSIKKTELNAIEYLRLESEISGYVISEHVVITKLMGSLFGSLSNAENRPNSGADWNEKVELFVAEELRPRLQYLGWESVQDEELLVNPSRGGGDPLAVVRAVFDDIQYKTSSYVRRRSFGPNSGNYSGALLGFQDFLIPIIQSLRGRRIIPDCPVFFLLDDADNLTLQQTEILNGWVSYRSTDLVSLKISTQLNYKTMKTASGIKIEAPHDYSEINFTSVYTGSNRESYPALVRKIVEKRLHAAGIKGVGVDDFFPEDAEQSAKIKLIEDEIKLAWAEKEKRGYRPGDDAYRQARPEYMRRLGGPSKQGSRYLYAGFEQLVHISSGIVRFFLEPAAMMYADQLKDNEGRAVEFIAPRIQDDVIRKQSNDLLIDEFDHLRRLEGKEPVYGQRLDDIDRLRNMIQGLGALFHTFIIDPEASQRRIFSFIISDDPPLEIRRILDMGVRFGYLYEDSIGKKSGMGRDRLYVLTRRLAPAFRLDPSGFSNYLSVTSGLLISMSRNPSSYISRLRRRGHGDAVDGIQVSLMEELDG